MEEKNKMKKIKMGLGIIRELDKLGIPMVTPGGGLGAQTTNLILPSGMATDSPIP